MRIGIDARELRGRATGVGRYLGGLLTHWAADERARRHQFVLYSPEPLPMTPDARQFATRIVPGRGGTWWEQIWLPAAALRDHLDIFFAPGYTAPLFRALPTVLAIHDLSFAAHPEWFRAREGARRRWLSRQAADQARAVITISQFSRRELVEWFGLPASKIHVVPPGISAPRCRGDRESGPPNVLYVGSIFNRRHVPDLIRAFRPIARQHPSASLDIVGDDRSFPRQDLRRLIALEALNGRVRWHDWVSDEALAGLYRGARAFAFLSEYEGLGLTPLEALAAGVPPVLLDTPVARESCGNAALYVALGDLPAATRTLEALLFDDRTRAELLAAAPAALARYEWSRAARDTLDLIEACAS